MSLGSYGQSLSHWPFEGGADVDLFIDVGDCHFWLSVSRPAAVCVGAPAPPERAPDLVGEAAGHSPHHLPQTAALELHHPHVVLQLLRRHVDVPRVPEHPPDQAEEDDDGASVDEQVVHGQAPEHPHHHDEDPQDVVGHGEPEGELAASHAAVDPLLHHLHLDRCGHGGLLQSSQPDRRRVNPDVEVPGAAVAAGQ